MGLVNQSIIQATGDKNLDIFNWQAALELVGEDVPGSGGVDQYSPLIRHAVPTGVEGFKFPSTPSLVQKSGIFYECIKAHQSLTTDREPGVGADWNLYWTQLAGTPQSFAGTLGWRFQTTPMVSGQASFANQAYVDVALPENMANATYVVELSTSVAGVTLAAPTGANKTTSAFRITASPAMTGVVTWAVKAVPVWKTGIKYHPHSIRLGFGDPKTTKNYQFEGILNAAGEAPLFIGGGCEGRWNFYRGLLSTKTHPVYLPTPARNGREALGVFVVGLLDIAVNAGRVTNDPKPGSIVSWKNMMFENCNCQGIYVVSTGDFQSDNVRARYTTPRECAYLFPANKADHFLFGAIGFGNFVISAVVGNLHPYTLSGTNSFVDNYSVDFNKPYTDNPAAVDAENPYPAMQYPKTDFVRYNGVDYVSLAASNLNNIPSASPTRWAPVTTRTPEPPAWSGSVVYQCLGDGPLNLRCHGLDIRMTAKGSYLRLGKIDVKNTPCHMFVLLDTYGRVEGEVFNGTASPWVHTLPGNYVKATVGGVEKTFVCIVGPHMASAGNAPGTVVGADYWREVITRAQTDGLYYTTPWTVGVTYTSANVGGSFSSGAVLQIVLGFTKTVAQHGDAVKISKINAVADLPEYRGVLSGMTVSGITADPASVVDSDIRVGSVLRRAWFAFQAKGRKFGFCGHTKFSGATRSSILMGSFIADPTLELTQGNIFQADNLTDMDDLAGQRIILGTGVKDNTLVGLGNLHDDVWDTDPVGNTGNMITGFKKMSGGAGQRLSAMLQMLREAELSFEQPVPDSIVMSSDSEPIEE